MEKKLLVAFMKKNCRKPTKKNLELKVIKRKKIKYMSNGKDITTHLTAGLIKKDLIKWVSTSHHIEVLEEALKWN